MDGAAVEVVEILHHPPPPSELVAMPASLSALIMRCLERRLEDRCPSIAELITDLGRVKRECQLDDRVILAAVKADAGTIVGGARPVLGERTREILAGSVPRHQGAGESRAPARVPVATRSSVMKHLAIGAIVAGLCGAGYLVLGRGEATTGQAGPGQVEVSTRAKMAPAPTATIEDRIAAGQVAEARSLAMEILGKTIHAGQQQEQGFAVERSGVPAPQRPRRCSMTRSSWSPRCGSRPRARWSSWRYPTPRPSCGRRSRCPARR